MRRAATAFLGLTLSGCLGTSIRGSTGASIGSSSGSASGSTGAAGGSWTGGSTGGGGQGCTPACAASQLCVSGSCVDLCTLVGQASCDGGCADLKTDNANCGTCGLACPLGEGCVDGGCQAGPGCQPGYLACPEPDGGIFCTDSSIDPENCGGCGVSCGTEICRSSGCVCFTPFTGCAVDAGGTGSGDAGLLACFDLSKDLDACGACGHVCVSCELCSTGSCTPQNPLRLSGYVLEVDAGELMSPVDDLATGDINGDGLADLVMLNLSTLGWSFGLSDGGFAEPEYLSLSAVGVAVGLGGELIEIGDFNHDGFADAILTYSYGLDYLRAAYLFVGSASGLTPVAPIWMGSTGQGKGAGVGDVNNDGWEDVVIGSDKAYVLLNTTDGGFVQAAAIADPPGGDTFVRFAIADLNGDGLPDIVIPGDPFGAGWRTQVAYQLPDGGFSAWAALANDPDSTSVAIYGSTVVLSAAAQIALVESTSDGGVCSSLSAPLSPSPGFWDSAAIDLNHDGQLDVVSLGKAGLVSFLRNGSGWDSSLLALPGATSPDYLAVLADGRVVVNDPADQRILIFNNGCGQ